MGVSSSTLSKLVNAEFHRLAKGRAYITLDEVLEFRLHSGGWDISTECIGVLFSIDRYDDCLIHACHARFLPMIVSLRRPILVAATETAHSS